MKTGANSFICAMRMACFACLLSATAARCQYGGIITKDGFSDNGNVEIDSFDSSDPNHSIWHTNAVYRFNYFSPAINYGIWSNTLSFVSNSFPSRTANATVFTDSNVLQLVGGIEIAGYLETGPNGYVSIGSQSSIGDLAWCFGPSGTSGETGIEPGHWIQNANRNFSSYPLPAFLNTWQSNKWLPVSAPPSGWNIKIGGIWWYTNNYWTNIGGAYYTNTGTGFTINGITYPLVITNKLQNTNFVYYSMGQLTQNLFVDAQYVVLYLTNGWNYSAAQVFTLNTNADIVIYSSGNVRATGNATINNLGNYARAFNVSDVAGYPISVLLGGNALATGNYYLPSSSLTLAGGGSSGDFVASIVCGTFIDGGHVNIHFDSTLGGPLPPSIILPPTNQIVQIGSDATFSVSAGGSSPSYQWYFVPTNLYDLPITNDFYDVTNEIPGATNSSLDISDVQLTDEGYYGVVVSNSAGFVQSRLVNLTVYTNATPVLSGALNATNGQFQLSVSGVTGLNYTLDASTNLVDWVPLWTNTSPFSFTDSNTGAYPQRFYRSVFIP